MIAYLRGPVIALNFTSSIIDVSGVGYEVTLSHQAAASLSVGDEAEIFVAESIREDSYQLYGFVDPAQRQLYFQLNSVTGVGPKATMAILSDHSVEEIEQAIRAGSIGLFSSVSGVGRKTASRIILELKGKLELAPQKIASDDPAYQALISLGFSARQAAGVLKDLPSTMELNERVKIALKDLSK